MLPAWKWTPHSSLECSSLSQGWRAASAWGEARGGRRNLCSQSSKFIFEAGGGWRWWRGGFCTSEETKGRIGERRLFLLTFGYGSETESICLQNLHFSSTKFSFQSPDRNRRMHASAHSTSGAWSGTRTPVPATGGNLERETCLLVHWDFAKSCLSACRRSTDNNLGTFFILYLNLDLFV